LNLFHENGLDLLLAEAAVRNARGDARIARAVANPDLTLGAGRALTQCAGCSAVAVTATLSDSGALSDVLFGKRSSRVDVADAALAAAKLDKRDAQRLLDGGLKQQFLAVVIAKANLRLVREAQAMAVETVGLVRQRVNAGAAAESDLLKVETDSLQLEDQLDATELSLKTAKLELAFWLGARGSAQDFEVDEGLLLEAAHAPVDRLDPRPVLSEALRNRPDLLSAAYGERQARAAVDLARRTRLPPISLWANYAMQGTGANAITPPTLTVGIETPIPFFYRNQGEVMKSEADLFAQQVRRAKVGSQVTLDVSSALVSLATARTRLQRMGASLLGRARQSRNLTALQYERGAASLLELLDSGRTLLAVNASYLQSVSDYWSAVFSVEQATGRTFH
jgi:cobalt-zinc-cadmium efflux system outer membrane protein